MIVDVNEGVSMLGLATSIHLDCPIARKEAKIRGIGTELSRLLIKGAQPVIAQLLYDCCPRDKAVFIHAIGEFTPLEKLATVFKELNIEIFPDNNFLRATNKEQINLVLSQWNAEILTIFLTDQATATRIINSLPNLYPKWWKFSREAYEAPYLKQLQLTDPFFFFSSTRSSLEILGSDNQVIECFNHARHQHETA